MNYYSIESDNNDMYLFDMVDESGETLFTDYHLMKKDIRFIMGEDGNSNGKIEGEKKRKKISTIVELQNILKYYLNKVKDILECNTLKIAGPITELEGVDVQTFVRSNMSYHFDCSKLNMELLVAQLVFDVLFDKYRKESEKMTLHTYAKNMSMMIDSDNHSENTIYKKLRDSMEYDYNLMKYSELQEELIELGIHLEKYDKRYRTEKKSIKKNPKYIWDYLFYNRYMITYRQFRRQPMRDSNTSYETFFSELKDYNDFVKKLLPIENESPQKYFNKSMDYYYLESYKRIDFMLKLAGAMPKMGITEVDREHFLVKRFHPRVLLPYVENDMLRIEYSKNNYYRPLFQIEEMIHEQMQGENRFDHIVYADQLLKYNIVRAKTFELFMYHNEYISSDYKDIKDFVQRCYNMRSYHESSEIWKIIEGSNWKKMDAATKKQMKSIIHNFDQINGALFWKSPNREFDIPKK